MRIGPRHDRHCEIITTTDGREIPWVDEVGYLTTICCGYYFTMPIMPRANTHTARFSSNNDHVHVITGCAVAQHCYNGDVRFLWEKFEI